MKSEFQSVQLDEVAELKGGYAFKSQDYTDSGRFVLRTLNIDDSGRITRDGSVFISEERAKEFGRFELEPWDTIFVMVGATLGKVGLVKKGDLPALLNQNMWVVRAKSDRVNPRYLYYVFGLTSKSQLRWASGAAREFVRRDDFRKMRLRLPSREQQNQIANILGAIDDKIELNRCMNESLEAIARGIFKSWFVDFDPVRAKANGESPESICKRLGLTLDLLAQFPDCLVDSELGEIPVSWDVTNLQSMTSKIGSGATPRGGREVYLEKGVALIRSQNVYDSSFVWDGLARISDEAAAQLSAVEVQIGDVLINITGASILRTCVVDPGALPARVNQHVAIVRAKPEIPPRYLHLHLLQKNTKAYLMGLNAGGSREAVTKAHLQSLPIVNPGSELLTHFREMVGPIYSQVEQLTSELRVLSAIRDALLPKLISGELRASVEGAT